MRPNGARQRRRRPCRSKAASVSFSKFHAPLLHRGSSNASCLTVYCSSLGIKHGRAAAQSICCAGNLPLDAAAAAALLLLGPLLALHTCTVAGSERAKGVVLHGTQKQAGRPG